MELTIARLNIESFRRKLEDETDETKRQMLVQLLTEEQAKLAALEEEFAGNISIGPSVLAPAAPAETSTACQQNSLREPGSDPSPTPHPVRTRPEGQVRPAIAGGGLAFDKCIQRADGGRLRFQRSGKRRDQWSRA